ncbi:ribonuclease HIII [Pelagirhabdus alkalitolerans]|uniref:Ribonuclease HIII n=1 Tax=Pelagirhabdus alkalitolerans TaxID=1612202 RepID=A0A1G6HLC7_9BACI|nr:ribonuclease HIII [Pelagirhabdus alkalitolerans]SDB95059.1 ribonuclease HIII [Pelagirhabdus alkalitolerans]
MSQSVLNLSKDTIEKMKHHYSSQMVKTPPSAIFSAKLPHCKITAYQSGKVLFQGSDPDGEANKWGEVTSKPNKTKAVNKHAYHPPADLFTQSIIGSDEAGTGDYFGPITVCACFVKSDQIELLKELGVKDSKNLTDRSIASIAKRIIQMEIPYSLVILHNSKYNQLNQKGWTQGKMKTMLHHTAITNTIKKMEPIQPDGILIDQFSEPHVYEKHLKSEQKSMPENTYFMTKAESHAISVATASIIARASFVKEMDKLSKQVGFTLPKGASKQVDLAASKVIKSRGKSYLNQVAKTHFKNTEKAATYL